MSKELYAIVAGAMRYVFVLLGVLIVLRAFLMLRRDRRETNRSLRQERYFFIKSPKSKVAK